MRLNAGQQSAVDAITAGRSVFLTGEGGTGKSVALREAVRCLRRSGRQVVVCAPTGIAAQQIHGSTIHSAFRFGLGPKVADALQDAMPSKVIKAADVIIIDEVGMVRRDLMDAIAKVVETENERRCDNPEEGKGPLQIVVVGDFSQLPPVATKKDLPALEAWYGRGCGLYAFESEGWQSLNLETHMLVEPMRQRGDDDFVSMLNRARIGDRSCINYFNSLVREKVPSDAVALVGTNRKAEEANGSRLRKLDLPEEVYRGEVEGDYKTADMAAPESLRLRVGARVIIVANDPDEGYVNGSTGSVVELHGRALDGVPAIDIKLDSGTLVHVKKKTWENTRYEVVGEGKSRHLEQRVTGSYVQYPIKLAWAITFHKSQGQTLEHVVIDPATFTNGQLYVGLSRATSAAGIWLTREIKAKDLQADKQVVAFYESLGWEPPAPATGDERPTIPAATEDESNAPSVAVSSSASEDAPLPTTMTDIMAELTRLLAAGGRAWARVYALIARVADDELYKPSYRSYSSWLRALAAQTGVSEGLLWHRKSAGDFYEEWRDEHPGAPELSDARTAGLSEENLNLTRKIDKVAPEKTNEIMAGIMDGSIGTKALRATWREVRQEASREREERHEQEERDGNVPSEDTASSLVTDDASMTVTVSDPTTWTAVLDALRAAGLL